MRVLLLAVATSWTTFSGLEQFHETKNFMRFNQFLAAQKKQKVSYYLTSSQASM